MKAPLDKSLYMELYSHVAERLTYIYEYDQSTTV